MAVAFNNTGTAVRNLTSPFTSSFSVTAGGSNLCAFAMVGYDNVTALTAACTYGGIAMTSAGTAAHNTTSHAYAQIFYLTTTGGLLTGANNLVLTVSGGTPADLYMNLVSFTGVHQTTPVRAATYTSATGNSTAPALTITSNASDKTVTCVCPGAANPLTTTQTSNGFNTTGTYSHGSDRETSTGASVTHTWGLDGTAQWAICGFSIQVAAAAGGRGLFRTPPMNGLGTGGSFFRDPMAGYWKRRDRIYVRAA